MADTPAGGGAKVAGSDAQSVLTRKVGPFPVWLWAVAAVGGYYWYTHYGPGASSSSSSNAQAIDPNTGVPYAEELANAQAGGGTVDVGAVTVNVPPDQDKPPIPPPIHIPGPPPKRKPPPKKKPKPKPPVEIPGGPMVPAPRPTAKKPATTPARGVEEAAPVGAPGNVVTSHGPVYGEWTADSAGVPEPAHGYAPMTAGSVYG